MVVENYPIRIDAKQDEIELSIEGEAGYVPLSFHGLKSPRGYTL